MFVTSVKITWKSNYYLKFNKLNHFIVKNENKEKSFDLNQKFYRNFIKCLVTYTLVEVRNFKLINLKLS